MNYSTTKSLNSKLSIDVVYVVTLGSIVVNILLLILLATSILVFHNEYVIPRLYVGLIILTYLLITYRILKTSLEVSCWLIILLYSLIGISILYMWGINAPIGVLILGFSIVLSGIMLGTRYVPKVTLAIVVGIVFLQTIADLNIHLPDSSVLDDPSSFGDVASYVVIFGVFALIAWLSGNQKEYALNRALAAEKAIKTERNSLATKLEEQSRILRETQIQEMKQFYKFAELGQLTTIILHELANYLSILTLDIEDINERHKNSEAISHAKESIFYIDNIIDQVRNQIRESDNITRFDAKNVINESITYLKGKLTNALITLVCDQKNRTYNIIGDKLRLSQIIIILVTNATQAVDLKNKSVVNITLEKNDDDIRISVKDNGIGISAKNRKKLFEPQKSLKSNGLGIGLYMTKQIIETHFKGSISIDPSLEYTQFNIIIPIGINNVPTSPAPHTPEASN